MENINQLIRMLAYEKAVTEERLREIEKEERSLKDIKGTIIIKKIRGNLYYYNQWTEDGKLRSRSLGAVRPGVLADLEMRMLRKESLLKNKDSQLRLYRQLKYSLQQARKELQKEKLLNYYTFEVYWKDEITARVYVKGKDVIISKFSTHPAKQLFAFKKMTRVQLNEILEMRCWDRERPDILELLRGIGLEEYNPQEIVRRTHGVSYNDFIWFRFPGEKISSKDVLVR